MQLRRRAGREMLVVGFTALAVAAGCARSAKPTAAEIVAKNVEARGGLEPWRKVQTMVWTGQVESAHTPARSMPFTLEQKRPNKTRMEITAPGGEKSVRVFGGAQGWRMRLSHGQPEVQPFTPQELKFAQAGHGIDGPLIDSAAKGTTVTLEGIDELTTDVGVQKAYHLSLHLAQGASEDVWVDTETFLDLRYDRMADGPEGAQRRVTTTYADYHTVEGLQIPFVIETGGGRGATPDKLLLDRVVLNPPLKDSTFEDPAGPRIRERAGVAPQALAPIAPPGAASGERASARQ